MVTGSPSARRARTAVVAVALTIGAVVVLLPLLWIVSTAFKPPTQYFSRPATWIPHPITTSHFSAVEQLGAGYRGLLNSAIVATAATLISMMLGTSAAYGLARLRHRGNTWSIWFLSQRILPPMALVIPIFLLMRDVHALNTWGGLIVPYVALNTPFVVWMMRGYFVDIPVSIEESALTDGCSRWTVLLRVVLPVCRPGLLSTAVFVYIYCWSEFLIASFITQTNASITISAELPSFTIANTVLYGEMAAISLAAAAPILVMGMLTQRYFVRGLTLGAVKR